MTPQKVRIISPDKCQIINPHQEDTKKSRGKRVKKQKWLDWEKKYGMPSPPKRTDYPQIHALKLELDFQKSMTNWRNLLIRTIADFRLKTGENVYWMEKEVFFESFKNNSAVILFQEDEMWVRKTVYKSELSKFQIGSIHWVQGELENGSVALQ